MCQSCGLICRRGYVVFPWGLAACVILGIDLLVTLKGACVCDIFLLVGFVDYLSPEEDWLTTTLKVFILDKMSPKGHFWYSVAR